MRNVRGASGSTGLAGLGDFWWSLDFVALARMGDKSPQRDRPTTPDANLRIRRDYLGIYKSTCPPCPFIAGNTPFPACWLKPCLVVPLPGLNAKFSKLVTRHSTTTAEWRTRSPGPSRTAPCLRTSRPNRNSRTSRARPPTIQTT